MKQFYKLIIEDAGRNIRYTSKHLYTEADLSKYSHDELARAEFYLNTPDASFYNEEIILECLQDVKIIGKCTFTCEEI